MADSAKSELADTLTVSRTPRLRTYSAFRLFAMLGICIGLPLAVLMLVGAASRPIGILLPADLVVAGAFGATMTASFGAFHYYRSRAEAKNSGFRLATLEVPHATQVLDVIVHAEITKATEMATRALHHLNPARPVTVVEPGKLQSVTPISVSSWGERLEIVVDRLDSQKSLLRLSSRSRLWTNFIDFGKGVKNVGRLASYVHDMDAMATEARNELR